MASSRATAVSDLFSLSGQTAIVTGATRGIGQAMALGLAEAGSDIILIVRDQSNTTTHTQITALGRKCTAYAADMGNQQAVGSIISDLIEDGHRPTILVNCAGIQRRSPAESFTDQDWSDVLQVQLTSVFTLCRNFGRYLLDEPLDAHGRRGAIINVASLMTFQGGINVPAYAAAKGGVGQLTKALSNEWASKGISVNAIAPGYIATEMTQALRDDVDRDQSIRSRIPAGRWGKPEDFKGPTVFLASRAGEYVSGEILCVDGGWMGR